MAVEAFFSRVACQATARTYEHNSFPHRLQEGPPSFASFSCSGAKNEQDRQTCQRFPICYMQLCIGRHLPGIRFRRITKRLTIVVTLTLPTLLNSSMQNSELRKDHDKLDLLSQDTVLVNSRNSSTRSIPVAQAEGTSTSR